jgi:hypothetical protein
VLHKARQHCVTAQWEIREPKLLLQEVLGAPTQVQCFRVVDLKHGAP